MTYIPDDLADPSSLPTPLAAVRNWPVSWHRWDEWSVWAVNAALASGRPLLLRGEPGTGKTQLARAAAAVLKRPFLSRVVNARMEPEDVLYRFDAVARLSEAQVQRPGAVKPGDEAGPGKENGERPWLKPSNYLVPEVLWWAINPESARAQHEQAQSRCGGIPGGYDEAMKGWTPDQPGPVVLLDEIDKADGDVPNSLLEVLASDGFQLPFGGGHVGPVGDARPLIFITTNEERELPAAFLRRCLVHVMDLPKDKDKQAEDLTRRVRAHEDLSTVEDVVLKLAIDMLQADRKAALERDLRPPGLAELIDLLRVVTRRGGSVAAQERRLKENQRFAFQKHRFET